MTLRLRRSALAARLHLLSWRILFGGYLWIVLCTVFNDDAHTAALSRHDRWVVGIGLLAGCVLGSLVHMLWPRDLVERLTVPAIALIGLAVLAIQPMGDINPNPLGFSLILGWLAGLVVAERLHRRCGAGAARSNDITTGAVAG